MLLIILDNNVVEDLEDLQITITALPGLFPVAVQNGTAIISIADNDSELIHSL